MFPKYGYELVSFNIYTELWKNILYIAFLEISYRSVYIDTR